MTQPPDDNFAAPHRAPKGARPLAVFTEPGIVRVTGEVDAGTVHVFRRALMLCETDRLVQALDLTGVTFFSAAGVGCLVERAWPTSPHPSIVASPEVRRLLGLCGLGFLLAPHGWAAAFDGWCPPAEWSV